MKVIGFIITLLFTVVGTGQENALTLEEAILRALDHNYQIQISGKDVDIAALRNSWGEAGRWPTVNFTLGGNFTFIDNTNNPAAFPPSALYSISVNPGLDFNWVLFNGMGIKFTKQNLEQLEEQSKGNAMVVIENTIHSVMMTYYSALTQQEKVRIMRNILNVSREKLDYYEKRQELGVGTSLDALQYKNQMLQDSTILLNYKITLDDLKRNLSILMGDENFNDYTLVGSLDIEIPEYNFDEIHAMAMSNNQRIKNQYVNIALQETVKGMNRSTLFPTISLNGGANFNTGYVNFITQDQQTNSYSPNYFVGLNIRYAIYNNGRNKRSVQVAKIQQDMAELQLSDIQLTVSNDLRTQYANYQNQMTLLAVSKENVKYARLVYEYGEKKYEASAISYFELNDFQNTYRNAMIQDLDNKYNLIQTYLDVFKSTGGMLQQYAPVPGSEKE